MNEEDVERSFIERLKSQLPDDLRIDIPGAFFSAAKIPKKWIEARLPNFDHRITSRPGEEFDLVRIEITCYIQRGKKGGRYLDLSKVIDQVRDVIDVSKGALAFPITDINGTTVGQFQPRATNVTRQRNQSIVIGETQLVSVDIGQINGEAALTGCT